MTVVIIIPTYNEKGNVDRLIGVLEDEVFPKITNYTMHILVVDDSSPDGTADVVEGLIKKYKNLHILKNGKKEGLGAAYLRAMSEAVEKLKADVIFEMDADLSHDPHKVPAFLEKIDKGYDFVIGTRYSQGGSIPKNWGINRKIFSIFGNLLVRSILMHFRIHDWTGGYRAIRKDVFLKEKDKLTSFKNYTFQVSFLHKAIADGFKVAEVPIHFTDRTLGRSKIPTKNYIVDLLTYVITARIKELERFIKFLVVGGSGFIIQVVSQEGAVRLGVAHPVAAAVGAETAIIANFLFNNFWTFSDSLHIKESSNPLIRLTKFNFTSLGAIAVQAFAVYLGEKVLGVNVHIFVSIPTRILILFPTIICIVIPMNYIIYNKIIWKTQHLKDAKKTHQ